MTRHAEGVSLELYRAMVEARTLEDRVFDLFREGLLHGTCHWGQGQEAVAAAFGVAMRHDDYTFCTYRGHAHTRVRGVPTALILAELMGRQAGLLEGKGGSMHLTSPSHGVLGSYAVVGAHLPIAVGAAFSARYRGTDQVAVCFFGDGAANIGTFHEALNLAAVWRAQTVFVCENNLYSEYTPSRDVTAVPNPAADRAGAYGLEAILVDGNDVDAMYNVAEDALAAARGGRGPLLIEALTYRQRGHSRADPATYRPEEEAAVWMKRDPIDLYRSRLESKGVPLEQLDLIQEEVRREVDEATAIAKQSPPADPNTVEDHVWAERTGSWRS